jgi:Ca2+:H+ antiporter
MTTRATDHPDEQGYTLEKLQLSFSRPETGSLFIGVIIATLVCGDGRSNWYKAVQPITVYLIIALFFYLIPQVSR